MDKDIMIAQQEFGQNFLNELNLLSDYSIKCFISDIATNTLGSIDIEGLEKSNYNKISIERLIKDGNTKKITLHFDYESIEIGWNEIEHKKEDGQRKVLLIIPAIAHFIKIIKRTYVE